MATAETPIETIEVTRVPYEAGRPASQGTPYRREIYDEQGRLVGLVLFDDAGAFLERATYAYDAAGRLVRERRFDQTGKETRAFVYTYDYDDEGRLREIARRDSAGQDYRTRYASLADGSTAETVTENGVVQSRRTRDAEGRLVYEHHVGTDTATDFAYDDEGNLLGEREAHLEGHVERRYTNRYDAAGRLVAVEVDGRLEVTYAYDEAGRVVAEVRYDGAGRPTVMLRRAYEFFE